MYLEVHDDEEGNSLTAKVNNLDYDYMAEQWVQDIVKEDTPKRPLARFVLKDSQGDRAIWEKKDGQINLTWKSDRFQGEWVLGYGIPYAR
jgi:hypothetical protein